LEAWAASLSARSQLNNASFGAMQIACTIHILHPLIGDASCGGSRFARYRGLPRCVIHVLVLVVLRVGDGQRSQRARCMGRRPLVDVHLQLPLPFVIGIEKVVGASFHNIRQLVIK
jgi:hypothetical protein